MKVSQWAEIRRLHEVEGRSQRAIARELGCDRATVKKALELDTPPDELRRVKRTFALEPYHDKIAALLAQSPELSAVRITEEIRADGYTGSVITVRILREGRDVARHRRSYGKRKVIRDAEHELQALRMRKRNRAHHLEETFDALGDVAREFHLQLQQRPVKTSHHLRRLLDLVHVYGRGDVLTAIAQAHQFRTYDAAYVETLLLQERRRRELPSPTPLRPARQELIDKIDIEPSDPAVYDRLFRTEDDESGKQASKEDNPEEESRHDET